MTRDPAAQSLFDLYNAMRPEASLVINCGCLLMIGHIDRPPTEPAKR